jgi:hypothetical protein
MEKQIRKRGRRLAFGSKMLKGTARLVSIKREEGVSVNCAMVTVEFKKCGHKHTATYRRLRERMTRNIWCPTCENESKSRESYMSSVKDIPLPLWKVPGPIGEKLWETRWEWLK